MLCCCIQRQTFDTPVFMLSGDAKLAIAFLDSVERNVDQLPCL